jgi:DNA-binding transcriptional LysR family regulator
MPRDNDIADLLAFLAVAEEKSFTKAAAKLGVSQSALSHTVRALEARMGVRLLTRTTRSVSTTEPGERLLKTVGPRFEEIKAELGELRELRDKPAGTIRITAVDYVIDTVLWPRLEPVLRDYPDIRVELSIDYGLTDIARDRYDIGVRLGDQVAQDMVAVRIGPESRMSIVGSPSYFEGRPQPREPQDLALHQCIALRLPTRGGLYAWELERGDDKRQVRVEGRLTFNGVYQMVNAALAGYGLAFLPDELIDSHLSSGRLLRVMADWCPIFPPLHLFYPSRRQSSRALTVIVDALRYRPASEAASDLAGPVRRDAADDRTKTGSA